MPTVEIKVPDIGDFHDVPVIEVLVKPGDQVEKEQALLTLESDKATMEVPSEQAGKIVSISVQAVLQHQPQRKRQLQKLKLLE
jgi:pyruvate/2-oxoglutarate dehydrogenase complex dihydrolipoamide acyltransferase (E2) component